MYEGRVVGSLSKQSHERIEREQPFLGDIADGSMKLSIVHLSD